MSRNVLIVNDDPSTGAHLAAAFDVEGTRTTIAATIEEARAVLIRTRFDLILTDLRVGGYDDGGLQVVAAGGLLSPDALVAVLTTGPGDPYRRAAARLGATHFFAQPVALPSLAAVAAEAGVATALRPGAGGRRAVVNAMR